MSRPASDRQLRRMVADLAAARPQDVDAVLGELGEAHRRRVEALLADYLGTGRDQERRRTLAGLSPAIAALVESAATSGDGASATHSAMTPAASAALLESAAALPPPSAAGTIPTAGWTRLWTRLARPGAPT